MSHIKNNSSKNRKHDIGRVIERVWMKTKHHVEYKTHGLDLSKTAEDIAAEAIEFALKDKRITWEDIPSAEVHLFRVARKVAQWRICDEIKKSTKSIVYYELDNCEVNEDGKQQELSKVEVDHVNESYRAEYIHNERMKLGRMALVKLDKFLAARGVSDRDIGIYKGWSLYNMSTDVTCRRYKVTPTNLHKIVCVIKQILRADGPMLLCA